MNTLFNKIFETGHFPENWSEGYVVPLHKKGNIDKVDNYRGITLLSHLSKLFTRVINTRLSKWAENYNVYVEAQAGFRRNMGTIDNVFIVNGVIKHFLNEQKKIYVAWIDFRKAYDYVIRDNLWFKLIKYGIRGNIFNVIKSMYNNVKSWVTYKNNLSEIYTTTLGLSQGECLSSFLFSFYVNDLEETLEHKGFNGIDLGFFKLYILLYADDIVLFAENADELQNGLNILHEYCNRWGLIVNTDKTKVMIFKKGGRNVQNCTFFYNGCELEVVNKFCYLGVTFTCGLSYVQLVNSLADSARKAIFKMNAYLYKFQDISVKHSIDLFDKLVWPIASYGQEVWGINSAIPLETMHMQFCKQILGVKRQTQNGFIYGELGRLPLSQYRIYAIIKYWLKILRARETKYVKYCYDMMLNDLELHPHKNNWASDVKQVLDKLGLSYVWINQCVENENIFLSIVKQRIKDCYIQTWNGNINTSSRANSYKLFCDFGFKHYLKCITIKKFRCALAKIRLSSHRLNIETGRWNRPNPIPIHERKCSFCDHLEDEYHFILECPLYATLRKTYICSYYTKRPNVVKFSELMKTENDKHIQKLSNFIYKAFELRDRMLKYVD